MSQHDELLMARAMMRRLWQLYDSGGHSGRSIRGQLLEAAFWPQPEDLPEVDVSYETLERIKAEINHEEPVAFSSTELQKMDEPTYFCMVVHAMIDAFRNGPEASYTEESILHCVLFLLHDERRMELFLRTFRGELFTPEMLIAEGRRRQELN